MTDSLAEFQDGAPIGSSTLESLAPDLVAPTTGQAFGAAFGQAFSTGPSAQFVRYAGQNASTTPDIDPETGITLREADPTVPKDQLNKEYGIPGVLSFDQDTTEAVAKSLYDHHVAEIQRNDILQRAALGTPLGGVAKFLGGGAATLLDPIGAAATFVPGIPEARVAAMLGDGAMGFGGRLAVRAITGASQGIAGTAALQPLEYALDKSQHDDWDMGTALSSIFYGGLLGGVLHPGLGIIEDARGLPDWAQRVASAPRSLQEDMAKGAIASVQEDTPRPLDQVISIHNDLQAMQAELQALEAPSIRFTPDEWNRGTSLFDHPIMDDAGNKVGSISGRLWHDEKLMTIETSGIDDDAARGKGFGQRAYEQIYNFAAQNGLSVGSDTAIVSPDAVRMYRRLEQQGWTVEQSPFAQGSDETGYNGGSAPGDYSSVNPVFTVRPPDAVTARAARVQQIRQAMRDAAQRAQDIADAQRRPATEQDAATQRTIAQRAANAPEITGDPLKDAPALAKYEQDFNAFVQQQKAAGTWGDEEDAAFQRINETQSLGAGDAKAYASAASCLARNLINA